MSALRRCCQFALRSGVAAAVFVGFWYSTQAAEHGRLRADAGARLAAMRQERIIALEADLASALAANDGVRAFVSERVAAEAADRREREARLRAATQPLPEGVRLAIETLHDLWRRSGHAGLRLLSLRAIADRQLLGVELFATPDDAGSTLTLWRADRVDVRLDRATSALTLWLRDGYVVRAGSKVELPAAGEALVLPGVDGPAYEERLPYLVVAEGVYPTAAPPILAKARLDPITAQNWRERLNALLATAKTPVSYRVHALAGLADSAFLDVVLFGSSGKRVEQMAEVQRLVVVVDESTGTVELELIGGVFRRAGGDAQLPATAPGQRILLAGVTPQAAMRTLTGMVVRR